MDLGEAAGKPWKGIPPQLGRNKPSKNRSMDATGLSIFSPNRQQEKTAPEKSHKLEDNATLENKRKNRQIHQGGFQSV